MKTLHKRVPPFLLFLNLLLFFGSELKAKTTEIPFVSGNEYFVSAEGNDSHEGSKERPFKSLAKISEVKLKPGDKVFFKRGDRFDGHFVVNGSGSRKKPILISSFGEGTKPILTGEVGAKNGGDYQEAILIKNNDNIILEGIEVQNNRLTSRAGVRDQDAYGIYVLNNGNRTLENFIFRDVTVKNVYAPLPVLKEKGEKAFNNLEVAGIRFFSTRNTKNSIKNIRNAIIENCHLSNVQRLGIHIKHGGGSNGVGTEKINANVDFIVRNNEFHNTGGTCVLPIRTYNCLIENNLFNRPGDNSDPRMANRGSAVWTWRCVNTVIQYNQCLHIRGYLDSHGVHIDHENKNTFVQYNYMEDCEGGFVEILGGNTNSVYRFNVSVNDGWRENPNWKTSNHTLWINEVVPQGKHRSDGNYIYNNTVVMNRPYATSIDMDHKNTYIFNNIFYAVEGANIGQKQVVIKNNESEFVMKNNLYFGSIAKKFKDFDTHQVLGNPKFNSENSGDKFGYQLLKGSPAIDAGITILGPPIPGAGKGIFKDVTAYPKVDFYGNPVDFSKGIPNIGACNAKEGELKTK